MQSSCALTCSHTAVQFVDDASPWPDHVSSVTDGLRLSVPASVDKLNPKDFSIHSLPLYGELMASCSSLPRFEPHASTRPVTDILDTALFFVAKLRALQGSASEKAMQSAALSIFDVLGSLCSDKIVLIDGPRFLLPRSLPPQMLLRLGFEGRALLLISVVLDEIPKEDNDNEHDPSDIESDSSLAETSESRTLSTPDSHMHSVAYTSSAMEIEQSGVHLQQLSSCMGWEGQKAPPNHDRNLSDVEFESFSEGRDNSHDGLDSANKLSDRRASSPMEIDPFNSGTDTITSLFRPIDILDAHVLPGRGLRTACLLPAVCVADEENINALVTSVACQQHALGISLPVLGFCLYKSSESLLARLVVGWVDGLVEHCQMPSVRLVTADAVSTNSPSFGVFDLLNPLSAVLLSQFVLGLSSHVEALSGGRVTSARGGVHWRADQTDLRSWPSSDCCLRPMTMNNGIGDIKSWVGNISKSMKPEGQGAKREDRRSQSTNSAVQTTSQSSSQKPPSIGQTLAVPPRRDTIPSRSEQSGVSSQTDSAPASDKKSKASNLGSAASSSKSASKLAEKDDESLEWLLMRGTMLLSVTIPDELPESVTGAPRLAMQVKANVEVYKAITCMPDWPQNWINGTGLELGCNTAHRGLRTRFLQELQQLLLKGEEGGEEQLPTATILSDDQIGFQVLSCRFSAFLAAVAVACSYDNNLKRNFSVLEAETRRPWDNILDIACSQDNGNMFNTSFLLERTINLPKNTFVNAKSFLSFLFLYQAIVGNQLGIHEAIDPHRKLPVTQNLTSYVDYTVERQRQRPPLGNSSQTLPDTAKADAIAISSVNFKAGIGAGTGTSERSKPQKPQLISPIKALLNSVSKDKSGPIQSRSPSPLPTPTGIPDTTESSLRLIILTFAAEYKKNDKTLKQAKNQCCFYLVALLSFLKSLGMVDVVVYGVVAWGSMGTVLMAWHDAETGCNLIFREGTVVYDLTDPLDAVKFGMTIHRIFREQLRLVDKLQAPENQAKLLQAIGSSTFNDWMVPSESPPADPKSTPSDSDPVAGAGGD